MASDRTVRFTVDGEEVRARVITYARGSMGNVLSENWLVPETRDHGAIIVTITTYPLSVPGAPDEPVTSVWSDESAQDLIGRLLTEPGRTSSATP